MTDSNATLTKRHDAYLGLDVGKESHWGFLVDRDGEVLMSGRVTNTEAALDAALAACPADTLVVVDQHRNIGALAVRRARLAGMPVAYLPGSAEHELAKSFPGIAKTDARDAQVIARSALGMPQTLRPVPEEDPALAGVRIIEIEFQRARRPDRARGGGQEVADFNRRPIERTKSAPGKRKGQAT